MNAHSLKRFTVHDPRTAKYLVLVLATFASLLLLVQPAASTATPSTVITNFAALQWEPWEGLPEGAEIAVLKGDQKTSWEEAFVRIPAGYQVPHHHHSPQELVLWIQGEFTYVADDGTKQELGPTAYLNLAPGTKHSVRCGEASPCLMYLKYDRPFDVHKHPHPTTRSLHSH